LQLLSQLQLANPGGEEHRHPFRATLGAQPGDVGQVESQLHQGAEDGEEQALLGSARGIGSPGLGRAVEQAAVLEDLADVRAGEGPGAEPGTELQRLVLGHLRFEERHQPPGPSKRHDVSRPVPCS